MFYQVIAEVVAHAVALFVGWYVRLLMDITNKKSFLERRDLLKTKCKLNLEKVPFFSFFLLLLLSLL